jgi:hypothetical protein
MIFWAILNQYIGCLILDNFLVAKYFVPLCNRYILNHFFAAFISKKSFKLATIEVQLVSFLFLVAILA